MNSELKSASVFVRRALFMCTIGVGLTVLIVNYIFIYFFWVISHYVHNHSLDGFLLTWGWFPIVFFGPYLFAYIAVRAWNRIGQVRKIIGSTLLTGVIVGSLVGIRILFEQYSDTIAGHPWHIPALLDMIFIAIVQYALSILMLGTFWF